jgi:hypothetical protein
MEKRMKWPFRFKVWQGSLKNRLLVSFLLLSLVPLGAASLVAYRTITDGAHEAAIREMTALAHSAAQAVNVYMNDRVGDQLVWSKMNVVLEALEVTEIRESANETLMDLVKLSQAYEAVMLLDSRDLHRREHAAIGEGKLCFRSSIYERDERPRLYQGHVP